ncbi:class I SAM-dependent methyltransferase [Kordiimonas aestuarii]|uniref:class I SAM-dependent methyltransferase n=1 Tax=Kordiimonas aestuarii TaxID=1005925 RepID=UPI0021D09BAF|nr:class I SAM-dependent methyltransferase [Kordiimonas aestuarii]
MNQVSVNLKTGSKAELRMVEDHLLRQPRNKDVAAKLMRIHEALATREFPDLEYKNYLSTKHKAGVRDYLEVGVRWGDALMLAAPGCKAVGVDPAFDIKHPLECEPTLYGMLSDDFFFEHSERYAQAFDLIFLDGLHEARQTAKDIYHALSVLKPGGEILSHDVLPISLAVATPTQQTRFWTGNVWQAAYAFAHKDFPLKWEFIEAHPSGLFRLYDIDPDCRPSRQLIMERVAEASAMKFNDAGELLDFLRSL